MKNLLSDSHSVFGLLIVACATVLAVVGKMTIDQWVTTAQWIFTAFMTGHAAMAMASSFTSRSMPTAIVTPKEPPVAS